MESLSPALVLTVAEEWPLYRPSHPTAGSISALAAETLSGLRKWSISPVWTAGKLWFLRVNTQLRKAPFSVPESPQGPGSILNSLGCSERFWGFYFYLRKEVWAMSIEGYMLAMELPLLLFLYYIYVYK